MFAPALAFAQNTNPGLQSILDNSVSPILNAIIPILITIGVIYFVWGIVRYVVADSEEAKDKGKDQMLYGIIGLFVIVTFWGLIEVLQNTIGVDPSAPPIIDINPSQ